MKVGLTVDSEGEEIDYNKVDTALKSVGISIKDAQGQFRDFDDVIFELSEKWDGLDKNTQRYIATIMAGNRQQSRFIALVDNWERLDEVSAAAANSADAGLLQYAKTLDSLDTKLNTLKTNFQQFYMSIFNGEFFKGIIDIANNVVTSFSRMGPILGGLNLLKLINQIKLIGQLLINSFAGAINKVRNASKTWQDNFTGGWEGAGTKIANILAKAIISKASVVGKEFVKETEKSVNSAPPSTQPKKSNNSQTISGRLRYAGSKFGNLTEASRLADYTNASQTAENILNNREDYSQAAIKWAAAVQQTSKEWKAACALANQEEKAAAQKVVLTKIAAADKAAAKTIDASNEAHKDIISAGREFNTNIKKNVIGDKYNGLVNKKGAQVAGSIAMTVGTLAQTAALGMDTSTMEGYNAQGWVKGLGGAASAAGQFLTGDWVGAATTAILTVVDIWNHEANRAQVALENAQKAVEEANIERAQKKEESQNLESTINNLRKLQAARYDSEEAMQAYIEASDAAIEKYPELANTVDASGKQMADVISNTVAAEQLLAEARAKSAKAAYEAAVAEREEQQTQYELDVEAKKHAEYWGSHAAAISRTTSTLAGLMHMEGYSGLNFNGRIKDANGKPVTDLLYLTNDQLFAMTEQLYDPNSDLYQYLQGYADQNGYDFYDIQAALDKQILITFGDHAEGQKLTGNAKTARQALQYHQGAMNVGDEFTPSSSKDVLRGAANVFWAKKVEADGSLAETWQDNQWLSNMATSFALSTFTWSEEDFDASSNLTTSAKNRLESHLDKFDKDMVSFYQAHSDDLVEIEKLVQQQSEGRISKDEYEAKLAGFGITNESPYYYGLFMDQYYQQDNASRAFYANAILDEGAVPTYEEFLKNNDNLADSASAREAYNDHLRQTIQDTATKNGIYLAKFVANASEQQLQEYLAITKEYTDAESIAGPGGEVARKRLAWMQKIYTGEYNDTPGMSDYSTLSPEAQAEFFRLLNTDAGTHKWAEDLNAFEKQYGVELGNWDEYAFENFSVRTQNIIDNAVSVTDTIREIGEKHNKGFSWEESQKLLKQIQAIDPSATWTSLFKVTEDGLIVLEDANETIRQLYQKQSSDLDKQQATVDTAINNFNSHGIAISDDKWEPIAKEDMPAFAKGLTENILGIQDPELEAQILAGIQSGAIYSYESLMTFLEEQREVLEAAGIYVDAQIEQLQSSNAFQTWSSGKVVDTSQMKKTGTLSDYSNIWTKKYNDRYDTSKWGQESWDARFNIERRRLEKAGAHIDALGNVIWKTETQMVDYYVNHLGYTRTVAEELVKDAEYADWLSKETNADKLQDAAESFTKELIETGEVAAETVDAFVQALAPNANAETQLAIRDMLLSGTNPEEIIKEINQTYGAQIDTDMIAAVATDSANERTKRFFELYGKWLEGTITETELIELKELKPPKDVFVDFSQKAKSTIQAYYYMLSDAIKTGNEEIIESARKGFSSSVQTEIEKFAEWSARSGSEIITGGQDRTEYDFDTLTLANKISSSNGGYSIADISSLAGQTGMFNSEAFAKWFRWDNETQRYVMEAGENTTQALAEIFGSDIPSYVLEAFDASEAQKKINDAVKRDNNLTSIPEKFISLISDPLKATTDELVKFWESLLGRKLTTDEFEQVEKARQAAINGDSEMLHSMLLGWMDYAEARTGEKYDVRWDSIKQASFGKNAQNQANIEKWLKGEGTIDDFEKVWMAEAGALEGEELAAFIQGKINSMRGAFIDTAGNLIITDYEEFMDYLVQEELVDEATLTQYTAEIQDTTLKTIKSIFEYINKAIEGTLTATELRDMGQAVVNSGTMSADEWHTFASQNVSRVGAGYKMNEAAAFALQVNTGNYDFEDLVNQFDNLDEVNEMLIELQENSAEWGNEFVHAAERVLESIKLIKAQDPKDAMFNWMSQDMEGWAGTYESTIGSIGKANDIINASMESGTMGLNDFYNMSQIVGQHLTDDALREWNQYRDAVYATATTVDGGTVSLTAGEKSMEYALKNMRTSTEAYYQDIARQQIDFIDKQIAALEAQKKVEEALTGKDVNKDGTVSTGLTRDELILNEDDYLDYGLATQRLKEDGIGLYNEADYLDAEKKWLSKRPQYVAGEDQSEYNTPEAFANTVSMYLEEATQDALKAGLDITDAQVQQQIKDSAMARAGVDGYYDTLQNEELNALTDIKTSVANIEEAVVQSVPLKPNTGDTGIVDNGSGSGNDTVYYDPKAVADARLRAREERRRQLAEEDAERYQAWQEEHPGNTKEEHNIEQQTFAESQQQTQHQASIAANTNATVTNLETTNSLLQQVVDNTAPESKTNTGGEGEETTTGVEQYIDSLNISDAQKQFYKDWYHDRDYEDGTNGYDIGLQKGTYPHVKTIIAEMDTAAKTISMRKQLSGEENLSWLPKYSTEEMQDWYLHGLPAFEATLPYPMWMWHEDPGDSLSKYTQYDAIPGINDNDRFLWGDSFSRLGQYGSGGFPEHHWARNLNVGPIAGNTYLSDWIQQGQNLLNTPLLSYKAPAWYQETSINNPEMAAYQYAYDHNLLSEEDRRLYEELIALIETVRNEDKESTEWRERVSTPLGVDENGNAIIEETGSETTIPWTVKLSRIKKGIEEDIEQFVKDCQQTAEEFTQFIDNYVKPAFQTLSTELQAAGTEALSRIMGEDPVLTESEIEAKAVADAVLGALDNLDNYNDNDELNYAAAIIEVSKTLQKLPEEWIPLLQKALGPDGTANTYLSAGDMYKLQTDFTPMAAFDTTTIKEDIQNAIIEAQEEAQAELEDNPSIMPVDANIEQAQQKINQLVNKVKNTSPSMNVRVGFTYGGASSNLGGNGMANAVAYDLASRLGFVTGNVNGLAFATGTEKLIAGANLANKALVGELGPELAVYNGQYHLLGANGAEFANIPSNAIIFNHKQTEGILKGQANIRGRVKDGGEAFAEGNVSGPAYGTGNIDEAIKALQEARAMWQSLLDRDLGQLAGISSNKGGGGGSVAKAYSTELQEWYNLLRQIADIEAEINQLVAERTNLQNEYNGEAVVRNLKQQQMLLNQQLKTQETLLVYQNAQLKRQAKEINTDEILSQFIEVNEDGIVQYLKGNEAFGGKGTLEVLSWLNDASSKEQLAFIKQIGFDKTKEAYDQNGKMLKDDKLVKAFFDYFNTAIKEYDGLQDTVDKSTTKLETINTNITKLSDEIRDNQMKLEQNVFDTIVDAWEANIDALEEQKELIEEANDAYTEGLREALEAERKTYEDEASVANREQLQRELSLLRRSGGSASEIADLEEQIDNALKDEYFKSQEDMIADIEEANKNQIELLEKQIKIEEETLEYQKENGIIWQQVATILNDTKDSIMAFFSGSAPDFFAQSKNQQIDALNEWSYMVGMYKEDQLIKSQAMDFANGIVGEDANGKGGTNVWETEQLKGYKSLYDTLDDNQKQAVHDAYGTAYQQAISEGESKDKARAAGYNAVAKQMGNYQAEKNAHEETAKDKGNNSDITPGKDDNAAEFAIVRYSSNGNGTTTHDGKKTEVKLYAGNTIKPTLSAKSGSKITHWTLNGQEMAVDKSYTLTKKDVSSAGKRIDVVGHFEKIYNGVRVTTQDGTEMLRDDKVKTIWEAKKKYKASYPIGEGYQYLGYSQGGLVDYTGLAMVHGSSSKPEAFLNAKQTAQIKEALMLQTKDGLLSSLQDSLLKFQSTIDGTVSGITSEANNSSINIQPGAVVIQVEELANNYDVEKLSNDVMNRMTAIAAKATNRGVNRR